MQNGRTVTAPPEPGTGMVVGTSRDGSEIPTTNISVQASTSLTNDAAPGERENPEQRVAQHRTTEELQWSSLPDDRLRPMVDDEEEALTAWIMGLLVFDAPPGFLECTHTRRMRIAFLQYLEEHLEGLLIAIIPAMMRMPKHSAATTLLTQLLGSHANKTDDFRMTGELIHLTKRTSFNHAERMICGPRPPYGGCMAPQDDFFPTVSGFNYLASRDRTHETTVRF